jgi:hypothetical protein
MRSRLLSLWTLPACDLKVTHSVSGAASVIWPGDQYYTHEDGGGFLDVLETSLSALYGGAYNVTVEANGEGVYDATKAEGRLKFTIDSGTLTLLFSTSSIDPRILGYSGAADPVVTTGGIWSDWVARYTWWPMTEAYETEPESLRVHVLADKTTGGTVDVIPIREFGVCDALRWVHVPGALMRVNAASNSDRATQEGLTAGDLNCSLERFNTDCYTGGNNQYRYYYDMAGNPTSYHGPYQMFSRDDEWKPLGRSSRFKEDTDYWNAIVEGETVP